VKYFVTLDGERTEVTGSLTLGRHLDNDLLVAGEDVLDFHLRIAPTTRGLEVTPLGEATYLLDGRPHKTPNLLIPGDEVVVGQSEFAVSVAADGRPAADEWWLYAQNDDSVYKVSGSLRVGRAEDSDVLLLDDHISRRHARIQVECGVWLKDLGSANGSYVNGERVRGGALIFHGDQVRFDDVCFQLVGRGQDLTPLRRQDTPSVTPIARPAAEAPAETTQIAVSNTQAFAPVEIPESDETGAFFLGASEPIAGRTFRAKMGRMVIGRDADCDIVVQDTTVSSHHAEVFMRPEGCVLTNLMATNGTRVNGAEVQSVNLVDGDVLRLGKVSLVFKDVPVTLRDRRLIRRAQWALLGACVIMVGLLLWGLLWS
jgi:pSer/pThr/pTyr-binding forkhead associated (FHA) protein